MPNSRLGSTAAFQDQHPRGVGFPPHPPFVEVAIVGSSRPIAVTRLHRARWRPMPPLIAKSRSRGLNRVERLFNNFVGPDPDEEKLQALVHWIPWLLAA